MNHIPFQRKPIAIATAVVLLHVGGLAALQSGLLVGAYEVIVPVQMISQITPPPKPEIAPQPPPTAPPVPRPPSPATPKKTTLPPAPQPLAISDPTPASNAPVVVPSSPAPLPPTTAPVAASPAPPDPIASPPALLASKVELPRSDADYLNNPAPPYPPVSKRLGEQGRVMVRVFVSEEGLAQRAELRSSSGFERLDATAVATALRYRFRPGTRGGVPEAMWVNVPFDFNLN